MRVGLAIAVVALAALMLSGPREAAHDVSQKPLLPTIAPAPDFRLVSQDALPIALADLRGKIVAVTFIFTLCSATCSVLTPIMSLVQDRLGRDFGTNVVFVSITVDPERDTPDVLKLYAQMHGAGGTGAAIWLPRIQPTIRPKNVPEMPTTIASRVMEDVRNDHKGTGVPSPSAAR